MVRGYTSAHIIHFLSLGVTLGVIIVCNGLSLPFLACCAPPTHDIPFSSGRGPELFWESFPLRSQLRDEQRVMSPTCAVQGGIKPTI